MSSTKNRTFSARVCAAAALVAVFAIVATQVGEDAARDLAVELSTPMRAGISDLASVESSGRVPNEVIVPRQERETKSPLREAAEPGLALDPQARARWATAAKKIQRELFAAMRRGDPRALEIASARAAQLARKMR